MPRLRNRLILSHRLHAARHRWRVVAAVASLAVLLTSCSIDEASVDMTPMGPGRVAASVDVGIAADALPAIGPAPGSSHWHAAYVVRVCDDVLAPFDSEDDPLGIHSHGDGLIHVHPFSEESGFERATMARFADAMDFTLTDGELTLPGGGTWRDGDLCDGVPGRVFVDRWADPDPEGPPTRIFDGLDDLRFVADGELYQIAFAPTDSPPVVPPGWESLYEVSNLVLEVPEPWVRVPAGASARSILFYPVAEVGAAPCADDQVPESVLGGDTACFTPAAPVFARNEAVVAARAVRFNRLPAVELTITPALRSFILEWFEGADPAEGGLVIAVEVEGVVVTAPLLSRPSASETRLVLSGGLSEDSAIALAAVLDG